MVIIEYCPACKSKNVQYRSSTQLSVRQGSSTPVPGLTNVLYLCLDCGAFITRNEYSEPMVSFAVKKNGRPIKLDGSHKGSSQGGCCSLAILFILVSFGATVLTLFLHM